MLWCIISPYRNTLWVDLMRIRKTRPEYWSWSAMLHRCYVPGDVRFHRYGGRGIVVCDRWRADFKNFLEDMGERPKGTTLDRIDNDGNYEPGNCRWADNYVQARSHRSAPVINGTPMSMSELARHAGINVWTLKTRLQNGWSIERAIATPVRLQRKKKAA